MQHVGRNNSGTGPLSRQHRSILPMDGDAELLLDGTRGEDTRRGNRHRALPQSP